MKIMRLAIGLMFLASMFGGFTMIAEYAEADGALAPVMRYVAPSDSTYTSIQDAIDDSAPGDTIYIANGTYNGQWNIGTDDLFIMANHTNQVIITPDTSGPTVYIGSVTNVTLRNFNFTSTSSQAMRVHLSDNITLMTCTFWSSGGTDGSLFIDECENITVIGDFFAGFTVIHSEGDNSDALKITNSEFVISYLAKINSNGDSAAAVACYGTNYFIAIALASVDAKGTNSDAIKMNTVNEGMMMGIMTSYTENIIDITSGNVMTVGVDVPDVDVNVASNAELGVFNERLVRVLDENDDPVEGVEMQIINSWGSWTYATEHFGGEDEISDNFGEFGYISILNRVFLGSNTPTWGQADLSLFYDGGDFPVSTEIMVDSNITDDLEIILGDFENPEEPMNVVAETISHEQIDLSFEASTSVDIDHYEIWVDSGMGLEWEFNTSAAGTFPYMGLVSDTNYTFKVISVDDDEYHSVGISVWNTTDLPVNGSIGGKVTYIGGPDDGMPTVNATVSITHPVIELVLTGTVNETGMYSFNNVRFEENYTITIMPVDAVLDKGIMTGYTAWEMKFDHTAPMVINASISYYSYDSDNIRGQVTYNGGPMNDQNALNATVFLYDKAMVEIANMTLGENGTYLFEDIAFDNNYTLMVVPEKGVENMGIVSGYTSWTLTFDHSAMLEVDVDLEHYSYVTDDIKGKVTYMGGSMDGFNATNATVILYNETVVEIANATVDDDGMYLFEDVAFGINYTLKFIPVSAVEVDGMASGYVLNMTDMFNHTGELVLNLNLEYYTYSPPAPTTGSISGTVTYSGGSNDGKVISGADVYLYDGDVEITSMITGESGTYLFEDVTFGDYALKVFPPATEQGETNVNSGYMEGLVAVFTLDSVTPVVKDVSLVYYVYTTPVVSHPAVTIKDDDGGLLADVLVTVTINGTTYTATTGANGIAIFYTIEGDDFPEGANFKAELDDYETIEWSGSDVVPVMKEKKTDTDLTIIIVIGAISILVIIVLLIFMFRKKEDGFEE